VNSWKRPFHVLALSLLALAATHVFAQQQSTGTEGRDAGWKFGTEIDVLPYLSNGYYASAFASRSGWRLRGVAARASTPGFLVSDGFTDKRTDAYAVLIDRFIGGRRNQMEGLWVGGGVEEWRSRIRQKNMPQFAHYNNLMLTLGSGYVWKFSKHMYLNPWVAVHGVAAGSRTIEVSGKTYSQPRFTPEASVKVGIVF
jgi:hypothetical protein